MKSVSDSASTAAQIDAGDIVHVMRGGIGASWHAMSREVPPDNGSYDYPVRDLNPRGSAYGGNPPVERKELWEQIYSHASWLGLNFIRVEISQRMYEPARGSFEWDNVEMRALYNILDWCEGTGADVFLQQMWGHVEWNAIPGVHPLLSAPRSLDDFADGIASLLNHLVNVRNYKCIRYFCITNEPPGGTWGYWWSFGSGSGTITPALKRVREYLDAAGIDVPLSGPDWTSLPRLIPPQIDFDDYIGAYDIHSYGGIDDDGERIVKEWVNWAHVRNKPFFLTEFGNMNLGWGGNNPGPSTFDAALSNASDIVRCMNAGADGFNRWSFVNRGDLDGQWQLIRTWDPRTKSYLDDIVPEHTAYLGFGIVSRFIGKYSSIVRSSISRDSGQVCMAALVGPKQHLTTILVNSRKSPRAVSVEIRNHHNAGQLYLYQVSARSARDPKSRIDPRPVSTEGGGIIPLDLPAKSISVVTQYYLNPEDPGVIE